MPGVVGDEVLKFSVERIGFGDRLVYPRITQCGAPIAHAAFKRVVKIVFQRSGHVLVLIVAKKLAITAIVPCSIKTASG